MNNYELEQDEVILYEGVVRYSEFKSSLRLTLTTKKILLECEKGIFKKERELVETLYLKNIKTYNNKVQVTQKGSEVTIQTIDKNVKIFFDSIFNSTKFVTKIIDTITGTTVAKRGTEKIKSAIDTVDEILGIDSKSALKGIVENGVTGVFLNGIKSKKNK